MAQSDHNSTDFPEPPRLRATSDLHYPIAAPKPSTADAIELREIAAGIYWVRIPLPISLDHINVYLLEDSNCWWLVDTGMHNAQTKTLWQALRQHPALNGKPITQLISTHYHYDHAGLAHWMHEEWDIQLHMSRGEYMAMRVGYEPFPTPTAKAYNDFYQSMGVSAEEREHIADMLRKDTYTPQPARTFRRLEAGQKLTIGERTWHVLIGAGHSPEHVCLYCPNIAAANEPDQPALLAGDQLIARISSNVSVAPTEPKANHLQDWIDSLHLLRHLPAKTLIMPSHQNIFIGVRERATELLEHHEIQILHMCKIIESRQYANAWTLLLGLFPKLRNPIDKLLALGEVVAHINWMQYQGIIQSNVDKTLGNDLDTNGDAQGCLQFSLAQAVPESVPLQAQAQSMISQQLWWLQPLVGTPRTAHKKLA